MGSDSNSLGLARGGSNAVVTIHGLEFVGIGASMQQHEAARIMGWSSYGSLDYSRRRRAKAHDYRNCSIVEPVEASRCVPASGGLQVLAMGASAVVLGVAAVVTFGTATIAAFGATARYG
ncbi:hypothetical protein EUGRSUZ_C01946 [Eucalyptus grandis]|uniref:Uncharacterized protein n=2 Tax=Eucalyptus grandis TaxID=71139 RepID=A0ACC3LEK8_EUCGR|nr:hypothetical protein EUGRSUZ_C01946 [Eucalyptus grandis]